MYSLTADTNNTMQSGTMVVYLDVGEMPGICCKMAVNKKNKLAYLENCSLRNLGRKVTMLYLAVETWLSTYLFCEFAGGLFRCMILGPSVDGSGAPRPNPNLKVPAVFFCFAYSSSATAGLGCAACSVNGRSISE